MYIKFHKKVYVPTKIFKILKNVLLENLKKKINQDIYYNYIKRLCISVSYLEKNWGIKLKRK